ncbi:MULTISPECIES: helix-turn-helix domain-containing protein [Halolamina]|uniref:Sugar-specific transcriptional regulator TrmB n=1 Tax=Halolamina pelagica TaxID=699431 RepID=A0A1I5MYT9_9EURY|nr:MULTISPECIES: helix-turn-helix domain-containing protein [Halolamina]NHX36226.1 TrmB family transcriptional regulator [Halolamina sp. R1-12]SFP14713.1 Sugar-specific transcriptional regulator TrmB [Halolamina pelagica]
MSGKPEDDTTGDSELNSARERLEEGADKAIGEFDQGVVDLLAWLLDTETRARIYVYLRQHPNSTSEEVAEGTGLYPSTVREALAELHDEDTVSRGKRESEGAGNNPYEYEAISPSELVSGAVGQVQSQLNAVFNLDEKLTRDDDGDEDGPVTISVRDADEGASDTDDSRDDDATDADVDADPSDADGDDVAEPETE